ncbi:GLE1-like protein-domain-containing protein [Cyathus striatus]|nr:GLE1-like protein-domain-containing protein [Cyathus striatus]
MRFCAPRSISPSPVRGLFDEESDTDSSTGTSSDSSYSGDTLDELSDSDSDLPSYMKRRPESKVNDAELRQIEETIAAIRLRARHHDPYEEWEKQARKDAYKTARKEVFTRETKLEEYQATLRATEAKRLADLHAKQMAEVQARLNAFQMKQKREEEQLREGWKIRDQDLWNKVEGAIRDEEEKVRKKQEEEKRKREEEERKRKEEELKRRLKKKKEEEEKQREETERKERQEKEAKEARERKELGATTAEEDWREARSNLLKLKNGVTRPVKAKKEMKSEWSKWRRQITPKIGQITNDPRKSTELYSSQLLNIMKPNPPHHPVLYNALLSSLSKAIIEQAETEVTAEKRSSVPLAQATWNLLGVLPGFADVLWAKLVQRVGGWAVPCTIPGETDFDGHKWTPGEREKAMGYRKSQTGDGTESSAEFTTRVCGIMRVYFGILRCSAEGMGGKPVDRSLKMFTLPRYWIWFARMLGQRALLGTGVAAQLIYTALDVMGSGAVQVWGMQWYKMLQLLYEGVTDGYEKGKVIGGDSPEGKAAQVRVQLEVERIVSGR